MACRFLFLLCLMLLLPGPARGEEPFEGRKRVLILHSYHVGYQWTANIMAGINEAFAEHGQEAPTQWVEFMDSRRLPLERVEAPFTALLEAKYAANQPDLVIASDDNAFDFMLAHGERLFPDIPVVFCGVNNFDNARLGGRTGFTGVAETPDIVANVELALSLHPDAGHLVVISDSTSTGRKNRQRFYEQRPFSRDVHILDLHDYTFKELQASLGGLPDDAVVLILGVMRDNEGRFASYQEAASFISRTSGRPMYSCWDFALGSGVVGGKMVSGVSQGKMAAEMAMEILSGTPVASVPVQYESPNEYIFDYGAMSRWGVTEPFLPPGSTVINRPTSLYASHKPVVWTLACALLVLWILFMVMARNIVQRRAAQKALARTLGEFQSIFDNSQVGILMLRGGRTIYRANQRLADIFGYDSPAELVGQSVRMFHASDERFHEFGQQFFQTLSAGTNVHIEYEATKKDGSSVWLLISGEAVDKNVPPDLDKGVIWVMDDISERMQFEVELEQMNYLLEDRVRERTVELEEQARKLVEANERLQELDKLKSAFLSTVSHELRTPMTSILGFAKLIRRDFGKALDVSVSKRSRQVGERINANLRIIELEGERLTRLINDVLDLVRIESGHQVWNNQRVDLGSVVLQAVDSLKGELAQRPGIELQVRLPEDLPDLCVDPDRLHQVLCNLLGNALKFTEAGEVSVTASMTGPDRVRVVVADQGSGIPPAELAMVFDRFHQVERGDTLRNTCKGSGLGLSICKEIVSHYGGDIRVESRVGQGTEFIVTLPVASTPEPSSAPPTAP